MGVPSTYVLAIGAIAAGGAAITLGPIAGAVAAVLTAFFAWRQSKGTKAAIALNPAEKIPFTLSERIILSHDTRLFRFALQTPTHILGLPIGQHMFLSATIDDKPVSRAYTPVSSDDDIGHFDLVVKVYEQGKMSKYLDNMKIGDSIMVQGPKGRLTYLGNSDFRIRTGDELVTRKYKNIGMMAGGTGITPMLQIITAVLKHADDNTQISLIFANQTKEDILCQKDLEVCAKDPRFKVWYTLDRPPTEWEYSTGFITADMIKAYLPAPAEDTLMLMCGPAPMVKFACIANLEKLGFTEAQYFAF